MNFKTGEDRIIDKQIINTKMTAKEIERVLSRCEIGHVVDKKGIFNKEYHVRMEHVIYGWGKFPEYPNYILVFDSDSPDAKIKYIIQKITVKRKCNDSYWFKKCKYETVDKTVWMRDQ